MSKEEVPPGSQYSQGAGTCIAFHAEENAILDCARRGVSCVGADIYVTDEPCFRCERMIKQAGIVNVFWEKPL
jgi:dCMP deaminase